MFNKQKDNQHPNQQLSNSPQSHDEEVYIMPDKFHPRMSGGSKEFLMITLLVIVLLFISTGIYFLYASWQDTDNQEFITNQPLTNNDIIANFEINDIETIDENEFNNSTTTIATTTDEQIDEENNQETELLIPPTSSSDIDRDGLTDLEEMLFGTSPSRPDSDKDGFTDGKEVFNGYSPSIAGGAKLVDSEEIEVVRTNFIKNNFKIISMSAWQSIPNESLRQVLINTDTGEIIRISVRENPDGISATNWYLNAHPEVSLSQLKSVTINDFSGVYSPNRLKLHMTDVDRIKFYDFEYIMDSDSDMRYPNIFDMIIRSFEIMPDKSESDASDISNWKTYKNNISGFEIKYPENWVYEELGTAIAFGTPESKLDGYIWRMYYLVDTTIDQDIEDTGNQFTDREELREDVLFADNIDGTLVTITTSESVGWISKKLYFDLGNRTYVIENGAREDDLFDEFYNSLKF